MLNKITDHIRWFKLKTLRVVSFKKKKILVYLSLLFLINKISVIPRKKIKIKGGVFK